MVHLRNGKTYVAPHYVPEGAPSAKRRPRPTVPRRTPARVDPLPLLTEPVAAEPVAAEPVVAEPVVAEPADAPQDMRIVVRQPRAIPAPGPHDNPATTLCHAILFAVDPPKITNSPAGRVFESVEDKDHVDPTPRRVATCQAAAAKALDTTHQLVRVGKLYFAVQARVAHKGLTKSMLIGRPPASALTIVRACSVWQRKALFAQLSVNLPPLVFAAFLYQTVPSRNVFDMIRAYLDKHARVDRPTRHLAIVRDLALREGLSTAEEKTGFETYVPLCVAWKTDYKHDADGQMVIWPRGEDGWAGDAFPSAGDVWARLSKRAHIRHLALAEAVFPPKYRAHAIASNLMVI